MTFTRLKFFGPTPNITRFNIKSNIKWNFIIIRIYYIESEQTITDKTFASEYIILENYKFVEFFYNLISSSKKMRFADQIPLECGYVHKAL